MGQEIPGFYGCVFHFDADGNLKNKEGIDEVREHFRKRFESFPDRTQHLFVFVHGVGTDFDAYCNYIQWFSRLYDEYVRDKPPIDREDITILGINWESQDMAGMLMLLLSYQEQPMPAQTLAEAKEGLKDAIHKITKDHRGQVHVHLTAHSMGAQVLLYLLPQLEEDVEIGSMMFLQGFAPSSAFGGPIAQQKTAFQNRIKETLYKRTLNWLYEPLRNARVTFDLPTDGSPFPFGPTWVDVRGWVNKVLPSNHQLPWSVDPDLIVKNIIDPKVDFLTANIIKVTDFAKHLDKVKGPILATTTRTLWADYQVGIAEISFYSPSGVLGVRGFERPDAKGCDVHDVDDDEIEGGNEGYDFTISSDRRFFNLRADPYYITDHDDFKNRAIVYAHLRAAGLIDKSVVERARSNMPAHLTTSPVQKPVKNWETWMQKAWKLIGGRTLAQVCMPGSHDAGMGMITQVLAPNENVIKTLVHEYVTQKAKDFIDDKILVNGEPLTNILALGALDHLTQTVLATARNMMPRLCITQTSPIREQLRQGCRFFDLRPALWDGKFYLAHGEDQKFTRPSGKEDDLGYIGGIGESLEAVLEAVASFASEKEHSCELIVLKFSHAEVVKVDKVGEHLHESFDQEVKRQLFKTIRDGLGKVMIKLEQPGRIDDIPLEKLLKDDKGDNKTVLCIYEKALYDDELKKRGDLIGAYWYGSTDGGKPKTDYRLYDVYAESRNLAGVIGDQWWKFKAQMEARRKEASDQVFLLSWTATLKPGPGIMDMRSIIDNAQVLNARLQPTMENWIRRGDIGGAARPNILYVDAYDDKVMDTVAMINAVDLETRRVGHAVGAGLGISVGVSGGRGKFTRG